MATIIRGTTPTITFTFSDVDVSTIITAVMTIKQNGSTVISKVLNDAEVGDDYISWWLSQEDTLSLASKTKAAITCDWLLDGGIRGRANILLTDTTDSGVDEVLE